MTSTSFSRILRGGLVVAGLLVFALWGMRPATPVAADPACEALPVGLVGYAQTNYGQPVRVDVEGNYAYLVDWWGNLQIFDISNPCLPVSMGSAVWYYNFFHDVKVAGDYAYVANDQAGLAKYDVSDPTAPVRIDARQDGYGRATSVALDGPYALVSQIYATDPALNVYDLATFPADPPATYTIGPGYPFSLEVVVEGDRAYIYNYGDLTTPRFQIVDISPLPNPPVSLGSLNLPPDTYGYGFGMRVVGDHAYLAPPEREGQSHGGLVIINVADDGNPFVEGMVSSLKAGLDAWKKPGVDVDVVNNIAYVAGVDGLYGYDVADPTNPFQTLYYPYPAAFGLMGSGDVLIRGDYAFVSAYHPKGDTSVSQGGLAIYKLHEIPPADAIYLSAKAAGTTSDGLAFGSEDILKWDGTEWSKWFDGDMDANLNPAKTYHNIDAFWIPDPSGEEVFLSFTRNQRPVPGIHGMIDGMDIVRWNGHAFSLYFDGQDAGLTTLTAENIDALHVLPGSANGTGPLPQSSCLATLLVSTVGPGNVPKDGGGTLKFSGEDVLAFCLTKSGADTTGTWSMVLDGSAVGMNANSTESISLSKDGQTLYLTTTAKFTVNGVLLGNKSMVFAYDMVNQTFSGPLFVAADEGLPAKVDGLQVNYEIPIRN